MTVPDLTNGAFEAFGGVAIALSIVRLHRDKKVRGVNWLHVAFFMAWGFWNLFFYPHLGQWISFYGGVGVVLANTVWFGQMLWYSGR